MGAHAITIDIGPLALVDRAGEQVVADATARLVRVGGHLMLVRRAT